MRYAFSYLYPWGYFLNLYFGLHPPDDFIFVCVLYLAECVKSPTLFVTTDRDFEKPEIIDYAKDWNIEIVFSTGEVIDRFYKEIGG